MKILTVLSMPEMLVVKLPEVAVNKNRSAGVVDDEKSRVGRVKGVRPNVKAALEPPRN
jgi:hypothetical protein